MADIVDIDGAPALQNKENINPPGMNWNEPNFHPNNQLLLFSGSDQKDAQGMDQYTLNIETRKLTNLTNSPSVWDEHGAFSPDGTKILFMSAWPYRSSPKSSKVVSIKTEFVLMDSDGRNLQQITHFLEPGYPETSKGIAASSVWDPDGRSANLRQLIFPDYQYWDVIFHGPCGGSCGASCVVALRLFPCHGTLIPHDWLCESESAEIRVHERLIRVPLAPKAEQNRPTFHTVDVYSSHRPCFPYPSGTGMGKALVIRADP